MAEAKKSLKRSNTKATSAKNATKSVKTNKKTDKVVKAKEIAQVAKKTFQGSHLAEGFISPIVQFIVGSKEGLEAVSLRVEMLGRVAEFKWGAFVSSAITLVATAFVIYLIINLAKLNKLDKEKK